MKNMIGTGSALERLKKLIPPGVEPKFGSVEEWRTWQAEEGRKRCEELEKKTSVPVLKKYSDEREFKICIGAARSQITRWQEMVSAGRSRWRKVTHRTSVQGSPVSYSAERREPGKTIWRPQSEITCWLVVALCWW